MTSGLPRKYRKNLFRVPLAGDDMAGDAVRAPSRSLDLGSHNKNRVRATTDSRIYV